jgi:hypothetical protein
VLGENALGEDQQLLDFFYDRVKEIGEREKNNTLLCHTPPPPLALFLLVVPETGPEKSDQVRKRTGIGLRFILIGNIK